MRAGRRSDDNILVRKIKSRRVKIENDKNLTLRDKRAWREDSKECQKERWSAKPEGFHEAICSKKILKKNLLTDNFAPLNSFWFFFCWCCCFVFFFSISMWKLKELRKKTLFYFRTVGRLSNRSSGLKIAFIALSRYRRK